MSINTIVSKVIRPVFVVAVLAAALGIAGGSSVRPPLLQADGTTPTPPVQGPCPCSDARCLPLCLRGPSAQPLSAEVPSALSSSVQVSSTLVAMETCPCAEARCLPLCHDP